jgi:hypothetical protein
VSALVDIAFQHQLGIGRHLDVTVTHFTTGTGAPRTGADHVEPSIGGSGDGGEKSRWLPTAKAPVALAPATAAW